MNSKLVHAKVARKLANVQQKEELTQEDELKKLAESVAHETI